MKIYKFVDWEVGPARDDYTYEDFIQNYDKHCSVVRNALHYGYIKSGGWIYDFKDELNKYLIKDEFGQWQEVYAPNKTAIRKSLYGRIKQIIELKVNRKIYRIYAGYYELYVTNKKLKKPYNLVVETRSIEDLVAYLDDKDDHILVDVDIYDEVDGGGFDCSEVVRIRNGIPKLIENFFEER